MTEIATRIGRPTSTVSREVNRNAGREKYSAVQADARAWDQAKRPKQTKLARFPKLRQTVAKYLSQDWSPELNLIERVWKYFKMQVLYNKYYENLQSFRETAIEFFSKIENHKNQLWAILDAGFENIYT